MSYNKPIRRIAIVGTIFPKCPGGTTVPVDKITSRGKEATRSVEAALSQDQPMHRLAAGETLGNSRARQQASFGETPACGLA